MGLEYKTIKEFSPDQAGERVGWIAIEDEENHGHEYAELDMAVGTVGDDGASVRYYELSDGRRGYTNDSVQGVTAVSVLNAVIPYDLKKIADPSQLHMLSNNRSSSLRAGAESTLFLGTGRSARGINAETTWLQDSEIPSALKSALLERGLEAAYPVIYYALNSCVLREDWRSEDADANNLAELAMPDTDMHETTLEQLEKAEELEAALYVARRADEQMKQQLTVFSNVSACDIPTVFIHSRRNIAAIERSVLRFKEEMVYWDGTYIPLVTLRTWPYMDPVESDEAKAFGRELEALKDKNVDPATSELNQEIDALRYREEFARKGRMVFEVLAQAEQAAL